MNNGYLGRNIFLIKFLYENNEGNKIFVKKYILVFYIKYLFYLKFKSLWEVWKWEVLFFDFLMNFFWIN